MLHWYELEERARLAQAKVLAASRKALLQVEIEKLAAEQEPIPLRRRLATALVQIGVRIDPVAAAVVLAPSEA